MGGPVNTFNSVIIQELLTHTRRAPEGRHAPANGDDGSEELIPVLNWSQGISKGSLSPTQPKRMTSALWAPPVKQLLNRGSFSNRPSLPPFFCDFAQQHRKRIQSLCFLTGQVDIGWNGAPPGSCGDCVPF